MSTLNSGTAELYVFDVTVPAGTAKAAPQVTDLAMPVRRVDQVTVRIPPGPGGEVGFQLAAADMQMIPVNTGAWVVADAEVIPWRFVNLIESGAWQMIAYNTGNYDHTLQVRFEVSLPYGPAPSPVPAVPDLTGMSSEVSAADVAALIAAEDAAGAEV